MTTRHRWLLVHDAVVVGLTLLVAGLEISTPDGDGANIGAGLVALLLDVLGLPWSLPWFIDPYWFDDWPSVAWWAASLTPPLLNVALHAALVRRRRRRQPGTT